MKNANKTKDQLIKALAEVRERFKKLEVELREINKAKDTLTKSLHECQTVFDSEKDLIMVLDTEFRIARANLATSKFLKKPLTEIVNKICYKLIHGIDNLPGECPLNRVKKSKKREEVECYLSQKDIWLQVSSDPIFDEKGKMTRIVHLVRDITEFKYTEAFLRESERRFRTVFDYANHGMHVIDMKEKKILLANKMLCQMLSYSKDEVNKLKIDDIYPKEHMPYIMEQFRKLLREEIEIAKNIPLLRKDGRVIYADISAVPLMLRGKTYSMGIFRDYKIA